MEKGISTTLPCRPAALALPLSGMAQNAWPARPITIIVPFMPQPVVAKLNSEINQILAMPDVRETLDKQGLLPTPGKLEALGMLVQKDFVRWADVTKRAKITAD